MKKIFVVLKYFKKNFTQKSFPFSHFSYMRENIPKQCGEYLWPLNCYLTSGQHIRHLKRLKRAREKNYVIKKK